MTDSAVANALEFLGIPPTGTLMVHSAFKQLALDGHHPQDVLEALIEYMEPGTLLMPTMSWRYVNQSNPLFDELQTPSNTGILTELFRTQFAEARSFHPTHSVAGRGRLAASILGSHHLDETPCSPRSPFGLHVQQNGWVLLMGISMDCCTLIHYVEEIMAPEIYLRSRSQRETYVCRDRHGCETTVRLRRHLFLPRDYFQFQDRLAKEGMLKVTRIDNVVCRAFKAMDMVQVATEALKSCPEAIIAGPGQRYRMM